MLSIFFFAEKQIMIAIGTAAIRVTFNLPGYMGRGGTAQQAAPTHPWLLVLTACTITTAAGIGGLTILFMHIEGDWRYCPFTPIPLHTLLHILPTFYYPFCSHSTAILILLYAIYLQSTHILLFIPLPFYSPFRTSHYH